MAFQHVIGYTFQQNSGTVSQFSHTDTFDGEANAQVVIQPSASNFPVAIAFDNTKLVSFVMWSDAAMQVVFQGSGGSTVATFNLSANLPIIWDTALGQANPFSAAVTGSVVTSTPGGNLNIYAGLNI